MTNCGKVVNTILVGAPRTSLVVEARQITRDIARCTRHFPLTLLLLPSSSSSSGRRVLVPNLLDDLGCECPMGDVCSVQSPPDPLAGMAIHFKDFGSLFKKDDLCGPLQKLSQPPLGMPGRNNQDAAFLLLLQLAGELLKKAPGRVAPHHSCRWPGHCQGILLLRDPLGETGIVRTGKGIHTGAAIQTHGGDDPSNPMLANSVILSNVLSPPPCNKPWGDDSSPPASAAGSSTCSPDCCTSCSTILVSTGLLSTVALALPCSAMAIADTAPHQPELLQGLAT